MYLHEDRGTIVGVSPIRDHPVNKGSLCVKGWNCYEFMDHPDRLRHPLIKENGSFRQASWDEALKLVAASKANKHQDIVHSLGKKRVIVAEGVTRKRTWIRRGARLCERFAVG